MPAETGNGRVQSINYTSEGRWANEANYSDCLIISKAPNDLRLASKKEKEEEEQGEGAELASGEAGPSGSSSAAWSSFDPTDEWVSLPSFALN